MEEKNVIGTGAILRSKDGLLFFQERDECAQINPNRIAPFGGGIESGESDVACILRELREELNVELTENDLVHIDWFKSDRTPKIWLSLFLVDDVEYDKLTLKEGKSIAKLTLTQALESEQVTLFTKRVLKYIIEHKM